MSDDNFWSLKPQNHIKCLSCGLLNNSGAMKELDKRLICPTCYEFWFKVQSDSKDDKLPSIFG